MSKYVDELIRMMADKPEQWCPLGRRHGIPSGQWRGILPNGGVAYGIGQIQIDRQLGVSINGVEMPTTCLDMMRLRWAMRKWYKGVPLKTFETTHTKQ